MPSTGYRPFEKLAFLKEHLSANPGKRRHNTEEVVPESDEETCFLEAMADVKEISEFRELPYRSPRKAIPSRKSRDTNPLKILEDIVFGRAPINLSDTSEYVEWLNPGLTKDTLERLHGGSVSVQDYIDLHGYRLEEAREEVEVFLRDSLRKGLRCVKIIHGRGLRSARGPVLKRAVCKWLERDFRRYVSAYVTARACDGGLGAVYVLLKM